MAFIYLYLEKENKMLCFKIVQMVNLKLASDSRILEDFVTFGRGNCGRWSDKGIGRSREVNWTGNLLMQTEVGRIKEVVVNWRGRILEGLLYYITLMTAKKKDKKMYISKMKLILTNTSFFIPSYTFSPFYIDRGSASITCTPSIYAQTFNKVKTSNY